MRSLRRLSVVSVASLSTMLVLSAANGHAQTLTAHSTGPFSSSNAAPFTAQTSPLFPTPQSSTPQVQRPSLHFSIPPLSFSASQNPRAVEAQDLAVNRGPCFTMRTYGFTTGRDPAAVPRLTSSTTCTPSSGIHVKELVVAPANH